MKNESKSPNVIDPTGGKEALPKGMDVRLVSTGVLYAVLYKGQSIDVVFDGYADQALLSPQDRALAYQILMLALRRKGGLEAIITPLLKNGWPERAYWFRAGLLTAVSQILLMRTADHAAVDLAVGFQKRIRNKESGLAGLMNAVLRTVIREKSDLEAKLKTIGAEHLPAWLSESWEKSYGAERRDAIAATLAFEPKLDISCKSEKEATEWASDLDAAVTLGTSIRTDHDDVTGMPGFQQGHWWVQDFAAHLPVRLLGDIKGKHVLDLCAAPGGKTLQLVAKGAQVTSVDRNKNRLRRLDANMNRTGLRANVVVVDASKFIPDTPADHILLDAPCSATGTFRRNPDALWTKGPEDVKKLAGLQKKCLEHAFSLLPKGGKLIYCVCSLEAEEGIDQIEAFLNGEPTASRLPITESELEGFAELISPDGDLLCLPCHLKDIGHLDGFYAARITKG